MGKSAKLHKRVVRLSSSLCLFLLINTCYQPKKLKSSSQSSSQSTSAQNHAQNAQKKASRKNLAAKAKGGKSEGPILGGADYVTLMMSGRRKAQEEAIKLPPEDDS